MAALRSFLLEIVPAGVEVVRGELNRVAEPRVADFIVVTPLFRERLRTNVDTYTDFPEATPPVGTRDSLAAIRFVAQLDIHGPQSADVATIVSTVFRDEFATIAFAATGLEVQPLYAEDPHQTPFENAEQQTEWRWTVDVSLQINPVVSTPQDFADVVVVDLFEVDTTYPP